MPGVMVAFFLPANAVDAVTKLEIELDDVEGLHITLAYLGPVEAQEADYPELCASIRRFAAQQEPLKDVKLSGTAQFGKEESGFPFVLLADHPRLSALRQGLVESLGANGFMVSQMHGFTPHMTLAYVEKPQPHFAYEPISMDLEMICVAWGDIRHHYKLGVMHEVDRALVRAEGALENVLGHKKELTGYRGVYSVEELEMSLQDALGISAESVALLLKPTSTTDARHRSESGGEQSGLTVSA